MAMRPQIAKPRNNFFLRTCTRCGASFGPEGFSKTKSLFYPDGYLPICNDCIKKLLSDYEYSWEIVDKICQYADLPFIPREFERLREEHGEDVFPIYAEVFQSSEFENLGWGEYHQVFMELKRTHQIEEQLPEVAEEHLRRLKRKWGSNYDDEALNYLEDLHNGLLATQSVNGSLQSDQALKICKMSYEIDCRIREGTDFDKLLSSYDKLVKVAEFTPKNTKNASDFDSVGELIRWLEKRGFKNKYFDGVTRDVVDETIKNIQSYNQRLYTNESSISEEINRRIEALQSANDLEDSYGLKQEYDLDEYENEGWKKLMKEEEETEFAVDLDEEEEWDYD